MQDLPIFTTEHGAASLVLREIPYKQIAYITIQDALQPALLLQDCIEFCKVAGAEQIYAKGHELLVQYPLHTAIWQMQRCRKGIGETDAALFPLTEDTLEQWRSLYNLKMKEVPNSATMTRQDIEALLTQGNGYFVHRGDELLGIGIISGDTVEAVIAARPHAGGDVLMALCSGIFSENIRLEVASTNHRAVRLYERFGFLKTAELSRWYDVGK